MALVAAMFGCLVVLYLPGVVLLRTVAGLDRFSAAAFAPVVSIGYVALLGLLPRAVGGFTPVTVGIGCGVLLVTAAVAHRRGRISAASPVDPGGRDLLHGMAAALPGMLATAWIWWPSIWPVSALAQNIDVAWHGYTTAVIRELDTGNPFVLVPQDPLGSAGRAFYPIGLHLVMALGSTGQESVAPAINATQFVLAVLVTPLGVVGLCRRLMPGRPLVWAVPPVLVGVSASYEAKIIGLPPYTATLALLPALVGLLLTVQARRWPLRASAVAVLAPAAVFAVQPAGAIAALGVAGPALLEGALRAGSAVQIRRQLRAAVLWALPAAALSAVWLGASTASAGAAMAQGRRAYTRLPGALRDLGQLSWANHLTPAWWFWPVTVAAWVGLVLLAVRGRAVWPAVTYALFGGLFVVAAGLPGRLRNTLTGLWFTDWYRLMPVATLAAALGLGAVCAALLPGGLLPRHPVPGGRLRQAAALVVTLALVGAWTVRQAGPARRFIEDSRRPTVVTAGQRLAFDWLATHVGTRSRVLNDWTHGTEWMYAIHRVVPFEVYSVAPADRARLVADFARLGADPTVAQRLRTYGIEYVITSRTAMPGTRPTLRLPPGGRGLQLVYGNPDAAVYRILPTG